MHAINNGIRPSKTLDFTESNVRSDTILALKSIAFKE